MLVSVVIPCRNEVRYIKDCVTAIFNSKGIDVNLIEVIIVDGISNDGTLNEIEGLKATYPNLVLINNEKKVTPIAFNLGIKAAKGMYVQIIGARQIISENYLQLGVKTIKENNSIWCVGGMVENLYENKTSEIIALAMGSKFGVGAGNFRILKESAFVDTVGTPMYPKSLFENIGLFDEALVRNQDDDFNYRCLKGGGKIFLNVAMNIKYFVRASYYNLSKQYYQYGYWKVYVNKKHKTITTLRQLAPLGIVLTTLMLFFLILINSTLFFPIGILLIIYFLIGSVFAYKVAQRIKDTPFVFLSFLILHFSYGLGYLEGILNFFVLNRKPKESSSQLSR